jgi:hypothetical protein
MESRPYGHRIVDGIRLVILVIALVSGAAAARAQGVPGFDDVNRTLSVGMAARPLLASVDNPLTGWFSDLQSKINKAERLGTPAIGSAAAILGSVGTRAVFSGLYPSAGALGAIAALAVGGAAASAAAQWVTTGKISVSDTVVDGAVGVVGGGALGSGSGWAKALAPAAAIVGGAAVKLNLPALKSKVTQAWR